LGGSDGREGTAVSGKDSGKRGGRGGCDVVDVVMERDEEERTLEAPTELKNVMHVLKSGKRWTG
jgi:hypothetical protein